MCDRKPPYPYGSALRSRTEETRCRLERNRSLVPCHGAGLENPLDLEERLGGARRGSGPMATPPRGSCDWRAPRGTCRGGATDGHAVSVGGLLARAGASCRGGAADGLCGPPRRRARIATAYRTVSISHGSARVRSRQTGAKSPCMKRVGGVWAEGRSVEGRVGKEGRSRGLLD